MRGPVMNSPVRGPIRLKRPQIATEPPAQAATRTRNMTTTARDPREFRRLVR